MRTSARNRFDGTVSRVVEGAINDEITIDAAGGLRIVATVTRDSRDELNLKVGAAAFALIKASSIVLVAESSDVRLSARNQIAGTVAKVTPGAVNTEVVLDVAGNGQIAAIVTNDSATHLGVAAGAPVTAIFKASSVIVGIAA